MVVPEVVVNRLYLDCLVLNHAYRRTACRNVGGDRRNDDVDSCGDKACSGSYAYIALTALASNTVSPLRLLWMVNCPGARS
jgi:hypothetical protein